MQYTIFQTAWGSFGFVSNEGALLATMLPEPQRAIRSRIARDWPDAVESRDALPRLQRQVIDYFDGKSVRFSVDVDLSQLTPFRAEVVKACRRIPYGKTASYGELAMAAGRPGAARAVGSTMAHNRFPLVVPCHRVIASDGTIGGFSSRAGVAEKKRLLALENAQGFSAVSNRLAKVNNRRAG